MTVRDEFFWLGEINKATLVINSRQGLLPMPIAEEAAKALREVLADGDADPTKRAKTYITFEPLMLKKADPVITLMHAGRSSQDMHATYRSAILRDHVLEVGDDGGVHVHSFGWYYKLNSSVYYQLVKVWCADDR